MQKFTTKLVTQYDKIVIENLAVKEMQMTHVASMGILMLTVVNKIKKGKTIFFLTI